MDLGLKGKRALVTGAGRGIGRAIALALSREGAKVAVFSRNDADVSSLLAAMGGAAAGHYGGPFDLMAPGAPERLAETLNARFGLPDILVHNVGGTLEVTDPFCSLVDWRRVFRFNFEIAVELDQIFIPAMRERRWGRVVHVGSTSSMENNGPITYCAAKAALVAYSRSMGRVLAKDGVVMSAVLPGAVFTEGGYWDEALRERPEHVQKYLADRCPLGRFGRPEDIAAMVVFLCSELAEFCQGSIVPVDGGQSRHFFAQ
ncbi:SDR family oxidoreductase [Patescibacteria group bacterium]|nr:MAG: SDR family oxidoreductase [Patescibacteria group bacterium]